LLFAFFGIGGRSLALLFFVGNEPNLAFSSSSVVGSGFEPLGGLVDGPAVDELWEVEGEDEEGRWVGDGREEDEAAPPLGEARTGGPRGFDILVTPSSSHSYQFWSLKRNRQVKSRWSVMVDQFTRQREHRNISLWTCAQ
jgi:hypothetical protein